MNESASWKPPTNIRPQELLVVACSSHFFSDDYVQPVTLPAEWGLDIKCDFSSDRSLIEEADALWFHGPSIRALPARKPGQKWIVMSMESAVNYPFLREKKAMDLFDISMTYQLDSDIPTIYPNRKHYSDFTTLPMSLDIKNKQLPRVLYAASNPVPYRDEYIKELMTHISVDSVGSCLHNKDIPGFASGRNTWRGDGFSALLELMSRYKFYLAFENSRTKDYVTERVFQALSVGTVPVYCGAENVLEFMPDDKAFIDVNDFDDPAELAAYLQYLDDNDDEYEKHIAWKKTGYSPAFKRLLDVGSIEPLQRMFIKLAHGCGHECTCGGKLR